MPGYLIAEIIVHYCIIMFYVYEGIQTYMNQHVPAELPQSLFRFFLSSPFNTSEVSMQ